MVTWQIEDPDNPGFWLDNATLQGGDTFRLRAQFTNARAGRAYDPVVSWRIDPGLA